MAQNTNLNVTPYYDDFDKTKNFYRVLFRPGFPIQARELTTMQSILQNQVENVGSHLFKDGSMIGLNVKLLQQYVEWIANRRLRSINLKPLYDISARNNPLPWTDHWISSKGLQVAPQETEVESYVVGGIKQDVKKDTFSGFKL